MEAARRIDELGGNAHTVAGSAYAALEHVAHTELAPDVLNLGLLVLVGESRVARDHEQVGTSGQRVREVLGNAVTEVLLFRVSTHVREGQHDQGRNLGKRRIHGRPLQSRDTRDPFRRCAARPPTARHPATRSPRPPARDAGKVPTPVRSPQSSFASPHADRPIDVNLIGNILDRLIAQIDITDLGVIAHLFVHCRRDADAAGLGQPLQARGDVHTVAVDAIAVHGDVAHVSADAELHLAVVRQVGIPDTQHTLDFDRALDRFYRGRKLCQEVVTREVGDATPMLVHQRADLFPIGGQHADRGFLVVRHQTAVTDYVGAQDCCELSVHPGSFGPDHSRGKDTRFENRWPADRPGDRSERIFAASARRCGNSPLSTHSDVFPLNLPKPSLCRY